MAVADTLQHIDMIIGGDPVASVSGNVTEVLNPATNTVFATVPQAGQADVDRAVEAAAKAFPSWSRMAPSKRTTLMLRICRSHPGQL